MMKRWVRRVVNMPQLQSFLKERHHFGTAMSWLLRHNMYFRRYSAIESRYFRWLYLLEITREVPGEVVELGVGPGSFLVYCNTWLAAEGVPKAYWGYDSFAGFPSIHEKDLQGLLPHRDRRMQPGVYSGYGRRRMDRLVSRYGFRAVHLVEGDLKTTVWSERPNQISFLYIDCDLYEGYKAGLEALFDRITPGGAVLFDEYERVKEWPGARTAVDEFFLSRPEKPQRLVFSDSHFVLKRPRGEGPPA